MAEELGEKTEAPTGKKLSEARKRGQLPKSKDLTGAIDLIAAAIVLAMLGSYCAGRMANLLERTLGATNIDRGSPNSSSLSQQNREKKLISSVKRNAKQKKKSANMSCISYVSRFFRRAKS